jgi:hypothetical protein
MSTVILDTITGKSTATTITIGSTPVISTSANSMTIRGEGTAHTSIQQGLAKTLVRFNQTGTPSINASFNIASIVDGGTGDTTLTITNDYANVNYTINAQNDDNAVTTQIVQADVFVGSYRQRTVDGNNSLVDAPINYTITHGDLA